MAVVAPAQLQGRTLSQAGSEEKTGKDIFPSELKTKFSTRGLNILEPLEGDGDLLYHLSGLTLVSQNLRVPQRKRSFLHRELQIQFQR